MADANCETSYDLEEDCCGVDLAGSVVEPEIEPPTEPPTTADLGFSFVYTFGNGVSAAEQHSKISIPSPYNGSVARWRIRNANDVAATAAFVVRKSADETSSMVDVGGTQPSITAAKGAKSSGFLDWNSLTIAAGECLEVEFASGDSLGVTLVIEYEQES